MYFRFRCLIDQNHRFDCSAIVCVQVKVLTNPGSTVPVATPVAISTTLPPKVTALSVQGTGIPQSPLTPTPPHSSSTIQQFLHQLSSYVKGTTHISLSLSVGLLCFLRSSFSCLYASSWLVVVLRLAAANLLLFSLLCAPVMKFQRKSLN